MKKSIAVFFGGISCEHDISIITGVQALSCISDKYEIYPVYISSTGEWYSGDLLYKLNTYEDFPKHIKKLHRVCMTAGSDYLYKMSRSKVKPLTRIYCSVLAMHGLNGEDGALAGFLQMCGVPVTSSTLMGASVGMDKAASKVFFKGMGLDILPYYTFLRHSYAAQPQRIISEIEDSIGYPIMVKPAMLGSSIGISKCNNRSQLVDALDIAISFDRRIICERAVENFKEINCSAMMFGKTIKVSKCEQPVNWSEFLKFEDKYMQNSAKGMAATKRIFPADIDEVTSQRIRGITAQIYQTMQLKGVVRADFIVADKVYINEVNTIPGSLSFYLWESEGYTFTQLLDNMIRTAAEDYRDYLRSNFSFKSPVLGGIKGTK